MPKRRAIILVNLGTPKEATASEVRRFLKRFLSDKRVVEIPRPIWWLVLRAFVLPLRCKRVAESYAAIWTEDGSPLEVLTRSLAAGLQQRFAAAGHHQNGHVSVGYAMTYSQPFLATVLDEFTNQGIEEFFILPLYPQYSATTTAAVYDQLAGYVSQRRNLPSLFCCKDYHDNAHYISALAASIRSHRENHPPGDCLLFSFHGIPKANVVKGDPYEKQCKTTAELVAGQLGLRSNEWKISFQSRFGPAEWLQPYTVDVLQELGERQIAVDVISPAFAVDCLETLEEMKIENRSLYLKAGGTQFSYVPCLNDSMAHVEALFKIITRD